MSTQYTTVPWTSPSALLSLRTSLFHPTTPADLPRALSLIQAWKLRHSNLPHAIEATYLLLSAQQHHAQLISSLPSSQPRRDPTLDLAIRSLYTQSFTRFITGFCDISRNRARQLQPPSMADVAKQIGLPAEFVDVRHEATHEDLPGLGRLVRVTGEGLEWLWGVYWSKLDLVDGKDEGDDAEELGRVLKVWRRGRVEALKAGREAWCEMGEVRRWRGGRIAEGLVCGKLIFPARRDLRTPLSGAFTLWQPLLANLCKADASFLQSFISALQASINTGAQSSFDAEKEALSLWLLHTLGPATWVPNLPNTERERLRSDCMMWCCSNPGYWSNFVGEGLLRDGGKKFRNVWEDMLEASRLDSGSRGGAHEESEPVVASAVQEPDPEVLQDAPTIRIRKPAASGGGVERGWRRAAVAPTCPIGVVQ